MRVVFYLLTSVLCVCAMSVDAFAQQGVITLQDTVIKGRIQKPEAFYILQHANLSYEGLALKPSFIAALKETVEEDPF